MTHSERADELFLEGYNCAQAVFGAFCDVTGLDFSQAVKMASSFGGGMGRLREVCGACSGIFLAAGMVLGYDTPGDDAAKAAHYARIQSLAEAFRQQFGTIICRELLANQGGQDTSPTPTPRTPSFYQDRPCRAYVVAAAEILDEMLQKEKIG